MELCEYRTVATTASVELKIEKSLFIGHAGGANSVQEAQDFISQIRSEHAQATHNCYAYVIGWGKNQQVHFHDHGEPSGTAGKPILGSINRLDLTNTVVVVTRYFGGRKLGVRGLIDAYARASAAALEAAGVITRPITREFILEIDYAHLDMVSYLITQVGGSVSPLTFGEAVTISAQIPINATERVIANLLDKQLIRKLSEK